MATTILTGAQKEEFVKTFAPALLQVLQRSGHRDAAAEDVLASLRDAKTTIRFETPSPGTGVMVECTITEIQLGRAGTLEVVIRPKKR